MAKISIDEGRAIAERAAWAERGKDNAFWHTWGKRITPPIVGLVLLWIAVQWIWNVITSAVAAVPDVSVSAPGIPGAVWIAAGVLAALTAIAFRTGRSVRRFSSVVLLAVPLMLAWSAVIAFGVGGAG